MAVNVVGKANPLSKLVQATVAKSPKIIGAKADADVRWLVTPSPTFNYMMGGGVPVGRMIRLRGPSSAGKSVIAQWCSGLCQREIGPMFRDPAKKVVIYMDIECALKRDWVNGVGLSTNDMVVKDEDGNVTDIITDGDFIQVRGTSIEAMCDEVIPYIETNMVAAVVFDSDGQAASKKQLLDESGKASFGGAAKAMSEMLNKMIPACAIYNTTLFWITQERAEMDPNKFLPAVSGGFKPAYACSILARITSIEDIKCHGKVVGHKIRARNMKNKVGIMGRDAVMYLNFMDWTDDKGHLHKAGFDPDQEYVAYFLLCDLLHKEVGPSGRGTGYFTNEEFGIKIRGEDNIPAFFEAPENAEVYEALKKKVNDMMTGHIEALDQNLHSEIDENADGADLDDGIDALDVSALADQALASAEGE